MAWAPGGVLSAYPSSFLHGKAAASGWAVVNAVGALMGGAHSPGTYLNDTNAESNPKSYLTPQRSF